MGMDGDGFCIEIKPHRSLGPIGFLVMFALVAIINMMAGLFFYHLGAWPVLAFLGLDVLIVWYAFRKNFIDANQFEILERDCGDLVLRRFVRGVEVEVSRFIKCWTRIEMSSEEEPISAGRLYLVTRGRRTEIGSCLGRAEKTRLSEAIRAELCIRP